MAEPPPDACAAVADDLLDVALRVREPVEVPELEAHLESCAACRAELDGLTHAGDQVALAATEVEPPTGFTGRTVAALGASTIRDADPPSSTRHRRRPVVAALVAVAACLVLVAGGLLAWRSWSGGGADGSRSARLVAASGADVGGLTLRPGDRSSLTVWLDGAPAGVTYRCVVVLADGTPRTVGSWTTTGPGADWTVGLDGATDVRRVEIRSTDGTPLASATL